jgi:hypothetical protein
VRVGGGDLARNATSRVFVHAIAVGAATFPCSWLCLSLLSQSPSPVIFCERTGKNARKISAEEARGATFHSEIEISPVFFPVFTGFSFLDMTDKGINALGE